MYIEPEVCPITMGHAVGMVYMYAWAPALIVYSDGQCEGLET